ncbi:MAG TPA: 1,3-beta-galactosyl-N-acetylhexosamine phosphorylase, partial [Firmicutes bacterium]|nr:1,3-beta-galactosyl-N-acetylhexosamine phosphorylase [Bacillota bacterium]
MSKSQGRVTLPAQAGYMKESLELLSRWGADAIRDCDGTELPPELKKTGAKIYSTYFVARGHNEFVKENMGECQQIYLMSKFQTARENKVAIPFMAGYFKEQIKPDYDHDPKKWWEVIDRTGGEVVDAKNWEVNKADETVVVHGAVPFHEYTVTFLAYVIWDPTQMYNHLTNNWGDVEHDIPFDVRKPKSRQFIHDYLDKWLAENEETDVVRFTTFFYHFTLVFNEEAREKYVDWFGYSASVSVEALEAFEEEKGYRLRPEDIVTAGYHNNPFICPTPKFRDFLDFQQKFVAQEAKKLVKKVQRAGKEAMMFLGDNWIGIEPYGKYFPQIGLDAVVGSVGGGTTLRMISEIPAVKYTEARFLPYFFPDTFREGNNPVVEAKSNWLAARRAILRKPVDRIGYGGYLSLAYKFPKFVSYVEKVADEFREIYENIAGQTPYTGLKVAVLNAWGRLRSWQAHMVAHAIPYKQTYTYAGVLEALSGSSVDVSFLSFDDILEEGIPSDVDVIINAGLRDTAFSGGAAWRDQKLLRLLREWIDQGGGFI